MVVRIYGLGWVGQSMLSLFPDALVTDPGLGRDDEGEADVAFICVPTPNRGKGALDTTVVEQVVVNCPEQFVIVRSTVNPSTCDRLKRLTGKSVVFMPEFLGESVAHPLLDDKAAKFLIIGGNPKDRRKAIELFNTVYNANVSIRQTSLLEAEVIKLSENRAIAFKVLQAQELYDACERNGVDYYMVRESVYGDDPRFNRWFTSVYTDKRGANSKCIPKDVYAWADWAEEAPLTLALLDYNEGLINE